ncbi:hypothetical protein L211DRAFT_867214 [Terfezia boudieri ATCC MYA-4762]|uniref:BTB domain-containing protein n=1 Tax=Terfezia boudieri ATCC MYA-4762 TaxID=1051890 RepID=A0A3N4LQT9_9PEZI|nr:hypothetical protein L211DRAFT_867214 [Terfezia boudieri ATCC MYA-4762]
MSSNLLMMTPSERAGKRVASGSGVYKPKAYRTKGADVTSLVNASVTVTGGNSIYVFGGFDQYTDEVYNHVLKLDLQSYTWSLIDNYGDIPCVRMGHASVYWRDNKLIVFGGENDQRAFLNDVYFFDIDTATWSRPIVHGIPPRGRSRHAVTIYDDKLFVVGGSNGLQVLDDICYLDLRTMTWSRSWTFVSRFDHQCWVWEGKLWVFGGLTQEMDRTAELVWLDISNSPIFSNPSLPGTPSGTSVGGIMSQLHLQSRPHLHSQSSPSRHQSPGGSQQQPSTVSMQNSQPASSGSRPSPTPPGATAAIKFTSGPNIPSEATGTHFHHLCGNTLLDFITPANTIRPSETSLSALDLKTFTWRKLADGPDVFVGPGYRWNYLAMSHDSTNAYLLGCASEGPENDFLSEVLPIDLRRYGMTLETIEGENPTHGLLGSDMASIFDVDPANSRTNTGIAGDFIVRAIRDEACQDDGDPKWASASTSAVGTPRDEAVELPLTAGASSSTLENIPQDHSPPIHVHRLILAARWPHFARMYNARMSEFHLNNLYIPEPYSVVRAFLYYLYTDSIAPSKYCTNISIVAGLLVMSNIYGIPRLRALAVGRLSREMDIESAAIVWERAGVAGEEGLRRQAAKYCLQYWGRVVRTRAFRGLSRDGLVALCAEVDAN